ncbi:hypothetical protein [Oceanidesulfovibrio marinus]|uniref:hypothetical protein n=1 Tax=Oceanidesulfovibrio marinus TaxID=370038 RepID=UPI001F2C293E|nr:hypothetical protein [Oceanidesulfovibrio marinus]
MTVQLGDEWNPRRRVEVMDGHIQIIVDSNDHRESDAPHDIQVKNALSHEVYSTDNVAKEV